MPRTFGDGVIHVSHFDALVEHDEALPELKSHSTTPEEQKIGRFIADNLVQDGATLQMGKEGHFNFFSLAAFIVIRIYQIIQISSLLSPSFQRFIFRLSFSFS